MFRQSRKGFSLLELIVVLLAIGILGTLGFNKFSEVILQSKSVQLGNQLNKIEVAINKYYAELGTFPFDVKWLIESSMPTTGTVIQFDALGMKVNGDEDQDVREYWSGPYITDMAINTTASGKTIKASFGDSIAVCAKITASGNKVEPCSTTVTGADHFINVLIIKGVDAQAIPYMFKAVNGRDMTATEKTEGNAFAVAEGGVDKLGIPSKAEYGNYPYMVYRFAENVQN